MKFSFRKLKIKRIWDTMFIKIARTVLWIERHMLAVGTVLFVSPFLLLQAIFFFFFFGLVWSGFGFGLDFQFIIKSRNWNRIRPSIVLFLWLKQQQLKYICEIEIKFEMAFLTFCCWYFFSIEISWFHWHHPKLHHHDLLA